MPCARLLDPNLSPSVSLKMADEKAPWKEDEDLNTSLSVYVRQNLQWTEILDFMKSDFPQYSWSMRSLDRRLRHFGIFYHDKTTITVDAVKTAVKEELNGPGQLLGYRGMFQKVRQEHQLNVARNQVYDVMSELDPEGLQARGVGRQKQRKKGNFTTRGTNWVHSLDGHDKLMGYQSSTFPIAIYGCMDTCSRKLLWLRAWVSNCDPKLIGKWYLEYLYDTRVISAMLRVDKGTETGTMATMHAFLRRHHGDMDPDETVCYGPSTSNQVKDIQGVTRVSLSGNTNLHPLFGTDRATFVKQFQHHY